MPGRGGGATERYRMIGCEDAGAAARGSNRRTFRERTRAKRNPLDTWPSGQGVEVGNDGLEGWVGASPHADLGVDPSANGALE